MAGQIIWGKVSHFIKFENLAPVVTVVKHNGQLGKALSSIYHCLFCYKVLLALIRDTVGSSSLVPEGLYKVL